MPDLSAARALDLLRQLIALPSLSRQEGESASLLEAYLQAAGARVRRIGHNVVAQSRGFDPAARPTLLLCSHHDTVPPSPGWTRDPYLPCEEGGRLYGLGSNDAGASLVCLLHLFLENQDRDLPFNLLLDCGAEEEISGAGGLRSVLPQFPCLSFALVGEPTGLKAAVAERGLLVLDGLARGVAGHAARNEGVNALYRALDDIQVLRAHRFARLSPRLGEVKLTVTQIEAGSRHNVVPDTCRFVMDIRPTEVYSPREIWQELQSLVSSELSPRNLEHRASATPEGHPLLQAAQAAGLETFISPTTSDWVCLPCPALKLGPGESARSHSADEFIRPQEIAEGLAVYRRLLDALCQIPLS